MKSFLEELAGRRRFGMRPGLETISRVCAALGDPQRSVRAIHIAGTNGKGAVSAVLDAALRAGGLRAGRYTSPHLVRLNERFFVDGEPASDALLERHAAAVAEAVASAKGAPDTGGITFFEALTAVAFRLYAEMRPDYAVLETGLGGRLDATNICSPALTVITRIGLDHCDWLGDTVEKIAAEKAGIVKPGVPVVLGRNLPEVVAVVKSRAAEVGAPFYYAPDVADESDVPSDFSLGGSFNLENAVTVVAALKVLGRPVAGFSRVDWPGRFHKVGRFIVDGAHNPPAARALAAALDAPGEYAGRFVMIAGFCGDKDVDETLRILKPRVERAIAVRTNNPRSLSPDALAAKMRRAGIEAAAMPSLREAVRSLDSSPEARVLVCGSLFLAGEALVELGAYPWPADRFDPSEALAPETVVAG